MQKTTTCFIWTTKLVLHDDDASSQLLLDSGGAGGRSGNNNNNNNNNPVGGRYPGASFGFYLREAFQSQTHMEESLGTDM